MQGEDNLNIDTELAKKVIDDIDIFVAGWRDVAKQRIDALAAHPDTGACEGCQEYDCSWCWVQR